MLEVRQKIKKPAMVLLRKLNSKRFSEKRRGTKMKVFFIH
jgi:hypothetical protein